MNSINFSSIKETTSDLVEATEKVGRDINDVLEPEVKDARHSSFETMSMMKALAKRVTYLFLASLALNAATLTYLLMQA